jgi:hypothetical protein
MTISADNSRDPNQKGVISMPLRASNAEENESDAMERLATSLLEKFGPDDCKVLGELLIAGADTDPTTGEADHLRGNDKMNPRGMAHDSRPSQGHELREMRQMMRKVQVL